MSDERRWDRGEPLSAAFVAREVAARDELRKGDFSRWESRSGHHVVEQLTGQPERLFVVRRGGRWYAGYKTISDYVLDQDMPGVFCSRVYWYNLLGVLTGTRTSDSDARLSFAPLSDGERRSVFDAMDATTELVHPFTKQRERGREKTGPPDGWLVTDHRAEFLALGEKHIRRYTADHLRDRFCGLTDDVVAYDPACSTGRFLSEFARLNPARIRTVGQDLSAQMVAYARDHLEQVHLSDAMHPAVAPRSVDLLFCRLLNSEVVSTARARQILPQLVATLRPGGLFIMLGHSPVLLDAADLTDGGVRVRQTLARQDDYVFQYYVGEKED